MHYLFLIAQIFPFFYQFFSFFPQIFSRFLNQNINNPIGSLPEIHILVYPCLFDYFLVDKELMCFIDTFLAGRCLNTVKEYYGLSLDIVRCLMTYMNCRRNETESCELLLHFSFRLEKLNLKLQKGIYSGFKLLEKDGRFKPNDMCLKIVYSSFEHGDLNW